MLDEPALRTAMHPFMDHAFIVRRYWIAVRARWAAATRTATAQDASLVSRLSARIVRTIGTRAPRTMPAASAPDRKDRLLASMLPASRSGTTRTFARPATGDFIFL